MLGGGLSIVLSNLIFEKHIKCELFLASRTWDKKEVSEQPSFIKFITNEKARDKTLNFNIIIHCASPSNITKIASLEELLDLNISYLEDSISIATNKVVYISSGEVYGGKSSDALGKLVSPNLNLKRSWYPYAKLEAEKNLTRMNASGMFSLDVIRLFHTFGPGIKPDDGRSFADILYGATTSGKITMKSSGAQVRSFLYLTDAIRAILMCTPPHHTNRVLNVGSPHPISILEFAKMVSDITGSKIEFKDDVFEHSPFNEIIPNISELQTLGWLPEVGLQEAIERTLNWLKREL